MKNVLCGLWLLIGMAVSQTAAVDSVKVKPWKHSLVGALTASQVTYSNWAQGGENALAWIAMLDGKSVRDTVKSNWSNTYKLAFGKTKLGDNGLRKTDDRIELESVYIRKWGIYVNPYISATLKTQFAKGYMYDGDGKSVAVSDFWDPGYLTQAVGLGYQPVKPVKLRLGLALREVFSHRYAIYTDNPKTAEIEKRLVQGGLESVINIDAKLAETMIFSSAIEMFDALNNLDEVIVRSNNTLTIKASKLATVILNLQLIQEKRITPRTQLKEFLSIGVSYTFL
jgi:hypothetical protein